MSYLQEHLCDLIQEHECVIIPDFAGFVTNTCSAKLNARTHRISPPAREVSFNARLFHNDGLFAQHLRMTEGVSYDQAMIQIKAEVAWIRRQLDSGRHVAFKQVGSVYKDAGGQLVFTPSNDLNYLPASFGLEVLTLQPVVASELAPETPVIPITGSWSRKAWRNLAGAAAVPFLVAASWFIQGGNTAGSHFSMLPFSTEQAADYAPRFEEEGLSFLAPDTVNFIDAARANHPDLDVLTYALTEDVARPDGLRIRLKGEENNAPISEERISALDLYFVVGGAFKELGNAESYVAQLRLKGYDAFICEQKGDLHLVAFGSYATREAATNDLAAIRANDQPGAWLKHK